MNPYTLEEFVKLASEKHDNFYTYTESVYVDSLTPITIECPKHGKFSQRPSIHLSGVGCKMCGIEKAGKSRTKNTEDFIGRAKKIHGNKYDYSLTEYKDSKTKILFICPKHGEFYQTPNNHLNSFGCSKCSVDKRSIILVKSHEKIIEDFNVIHKGRYDYSLMVYKNARSKIKILCDKHGEFQQTPDSHRKGVGCPKCAVEKRTKTRTLTNVEAIRRFEDVHGKKYDYSLVEYKKSSIKVKIICPTHGVFEQTPGNHIYGQGCPKCGDLEVVKILSKPQEQVLLEFKAKHGNRYDYSLVDYVNTNSKVRIICHIHGEFQQSPTHHKIGVGCPKCKYESLSKIRALSKDKVIQAFYETHGSKYNYSLVEYKNTMTQVKIICPTHGEFEQTPDKHKSGQGCPVCSNTLSKEQIKLAEFLKSITRVQTDYVYDKSTSRREVDCYLPEFNLAVEYDGLWWHSTRFREPNYHKQKRDELKAVGIDLIRIFEDEWLTKQEQVKNLLAMRLGKNSNKIYARQTRLEPISSEEAKDFYNLYHIQGQTRANGVSLCLKHEDKVVAVMTFTQNFSHRGLVQENLQELSRFASSTQVVGGASKLFKALIKLTKAEEVVSYSDNRLFTGKTYEALGFTKEHETRPDYYYIRSGNNARLHKSNFRHSNLPKMIGDLYDPSLTEKQNAENAGWYQIYNCGLTKWRYKV